jgi:hypothetical protein
MGSLFSSGPDPLPPPDFSRLDALSEKLAQQANNDQPWANPTTGQIQFTNNAHETLRNTLNAQSAQRGVRSSQLASMGNNALANQQNVLAGQAALRDAAEREAAQNQLMNIELQKAGQIAAVNQANAQIEQEKRAAQDRMIGMGVTAAGYAFGGPAGGMAANQAWSGLTSNSTPTGSPVGASMGANPYAGAPASPASMQYNPSQYNMAQGLQFQGSY